VTFTARGKPRGSCTVHPRFEFVRAIDDKKKIFIPHTPYSVDHHHRKYTRKGRDGSSQLRVMILQLRIGIPTWQGVLHAHCDQPLSDSNFCSVQDDRRCRLQNAVVPSGPFQPVMGPLWSPTIALCPVAACQKSPSSCHPMSLAWMGLFRI
jgi:hypothetical protein